MNPLRVRLDNALRNAMLQRTQLRGSVSKAKGNLAPQSLVNRGKYRAGEKVDEAVDLAQKGLRKYRVPVALAAFAGLAYSLRRPLGKALPRISDKLGELADQTMDFAKARFGVDIDEDQAEKDDEITE